MRTLSIVGCGAVGKTVGRLFHDAGLFELLDVLTLSDDSARAAAGFIGAGRPLSDFNRLRPADCYLLAAPDDSIAACAGKLAAAGLAGTGSVVWHASGALSSQVLEPAAVQGAQVASVHPVKSFADPSVCIGDFAGTWCGIEGDVAAVALLTGAFESVGARTFRVDPRFKTIYHAGSVLVCNYLTALVEAGARAYQRGGLERETALEVMEPLVRGTVDNIFRTGTAKALTGPIARGDVALVSRQLEALQEWNGDIAEIYRSLAVVAVELSRLRGQADEAALKALEGMLAKPSKTTGYTMRQDHDGKRR